MSYESITRSQETRRIQAILREAGIESEIDGDGDLEFHVEGQGRMLLLYASVAQDAQSLRIFGQWALDAKVPPDELLRLRKCNELTRDLGLTKVSLVDNWVLTAIDIPLNWGNLSSDLIEGLIRKVVQDSEYFFHNWHI